MPPCNHAVTRSGSLEVPGDQATIQLDPPVRHPCTAQFEFVPHGKSDEILAGERLDSVDEDVGEVHLDGLSAGHITVTLNSNPTGSIRVMVECEGGEEACGPTYTTIQLAGFEQNVVVQAVD